MRGSVNQPGSLFPTSRKHNDRSARKGFDSIVILTTWMVWKDRNARVFNWILNNEDQVVSAIIAEAAD